MQKGAYTRSRERTDCKLQVQGRVSCVILWCTKFLRPRCFTHLVHYSLTYVSAIAQRRLKFSGPAVFSDLPEKVQGILTRSLKCTKFVRPLPVRQETHREPIKYRRYYRQKIIFIESSGSSKAAPKKLLHTNLFLVPNDYLLKLSFTSLVLKTRSHQSANYTKDERIASRAHRGVPHCRPVRIATPCVGSALELG